jgi:hypothetical protein
LESSSTTTTSADPAAAAAAAAAAAVSVAAAAPASAPASAPAPAPASAPAPSPAPAPAPAPARDADPDADSNTSNNLSVLNRSTTVTTAQVMKHQHIYCHMRTRGTYSDFRIAPGGATMWHYAHSGETWFYFISPTTENLLKYEQWYMSPDHEQIFFGDLVDHCFKVQVQKVRLFSSF